MFCNTILFAGSVAHLGERLHGMEEVASSILVGSTKIVKTPPFIGPNRCDIKGVLICLVEGYMSEIDMGYRTTCGLKE